MTSITTKKTIERQPMSVPKAAPRRAISDSQPLERLAMRKWSATFLVWIFGLQFLYLGALVWGALAPGVGKGVPGLLSRDLPSGAFLLALTFIAGIGFGLRANKARLQYVLVLTGLGTNAFATLAYWLRGETSLISVGVHGGLFCVLLVSIVSIANTQTRPSRYAQHAVMPTIAISLFVIAAGLGASQGSAAGEFININLSEWVRYGIAAVMALFAACIFFNHISHVLFIVLVSPYMAYVGIVVYLLAIDPRTSLVGVIGNIGFFISIIFIALIQMQQYIRPRIEGNAS